jgi:hypothetical protein
MAIGGIRVKHVPTARSRETVLMLTAYGIKQPDIGIILGCSVDTLANYYRDELDRGLVEVNAEVAKNLFRIATSSEKGAVQAAIFWLKCRAKWRTTEVDDLLKEMENLRGKLVEAEERLSRLGSPRLVA